MEIDQIKTFLAVATFGGFHRAAEGLRISQPAVSARIKALEESLGTSLFARSRSGLTLSEAGRILRPYAEELLRTASLASQAVHELKPASAGPLQIAAAHSISVYFLPDFLKRFQRVYPKVVISIRAGHSKEVLEMVLNQEAEIGLARSLNHPEVETLSLRDDPLLLVGHPKHSPTRARGARASKRWQTGRWSSTSADQATGLSLTVSSAAPAWSQTSLWKWTRSKPPSAWWIAAWAWPSFLNSPWDRSCVPANLRPSSFSTPSLWAEAWTSFIAGIVPCAKRRRHFSM